MAIITYPLASCLPVSHSHPSSTLSRFPPGWLSHTQCSRCPALQPHPHWVFCLKHNAALLYCAMGCLWAFSYAISLVSFSLPSLLDSFYSSSKTQLGKCCLTWKCCSGSLLTWGPSTAFRTGILETLGNCFIMLLPVGLFVFFPSLVLSQWPAWKQGLCTYGFVFIPNTSTDLGMVINTAGRLPHRLSGRRKWGDILLWGMRASFPPNSRIHELWVRAHLWGQSEWRTLRRKPCQWLHGGGFRLVPSLQFCEHGTAVRFASRSSSAPPLPCLTCGPRKGQSTSWSWKLMRRTESSLL